MSETKEKVLMLRNRLATMPDPDGMTAAYQSLYLIAVEAVEGCEALEAECEEAHELMERSGNNVMTAGREIERLREGIAWAHERATDGNEHEVPRILLDLMPNAQVKPLARSASRLEPLVGPDGDDK